MTDKQRCLWVVTFEFIFAIQTLLIGMIGKWLINPRNIWRTRCGQLLPVAASAN